MSLSETDEFLSLSADFELNDSANDEDSTFDELDLLKLDLLEALDETEYFELIECELSLELTTDEDLADIEPFVVPETSFASDFETDDALSLEAEIALPLSEPVVAVDDDADTEEATLEWLASETLPLPTILATVEEALASEELAADGVTDELAAEVVSFSTK